MAGQGGERRHPHTLPLCRATPGSAVLRVGVGSRAWFFQLLGSFCQKVREEGVGAVAGGEGWEWRGEVGGGLLCSMEGSVFPWKHSVDSCPPPLSHCSLFLEQRLAAERRPQAHLDGPAVTSPASAPETKPPAGIEPRPQPQPCLEEGNQGRCPESHLPPHPVPPNQSNTVQAMPSEGSRWGHSGQAPAFGKARRPVTGPLPL